MEDTNKNIDGIKLIEESMFTRYYPEVLKTWFKISTKLKDIDNIMISPPMIRMRSIHIGIQISRITSDDGRHDTITEKKSTMVYVNSDREIYIRFSKDHYSTQYTFDDIDRAVNFIYEHFTKEDENDKGENHHAVM